MNGFVRQLRPAAVALAAFTLVCGVAYPLAVTVLAQLVFADEANGSLRSVDGRPVGSELIGQQFESPRYFHPRPSSAGDGYDAGASAGSNLGPNNPALAQAVAERVASYRTINGLSDDVPVPVDAVTSSGSGLDPHISLANARLQAPRVAAARGMEVDDVLVLVEQAVDGRHMFVLGDPGVNVLVLNLLLDEAD
ncbi:MAG TPA: potassium-transporting ATPase subunit C [Acidimicrobiaceae bacterium]|nr:potassium-transporting ATPase subunit C [Acidimicrobiaceae bacterium]